MIKIKNQSREIIVQQRIVFSLIFALLFLYGFQQSLNSTFPPLGATAAALESHPTISIYNDLDLENAKVSGAGTPSDPFILANWEISGGSDFAIYITGTTKHFIIKDCTLDGVQSEYHGIYLSNVNQGPMGISGKTTIEGCAIKNCKVAIGVYDSNFVFIDGKYQKIIGTEASGTGSLLWEHNYGDMLHQEANAVIETSDNGLAFAGFSSGWFLEF